MQAGGAVDYGPFPPEHNKSRLSSLFLPRKETPESLLSAEIALAGNIMAFTYYYPL